jgi:hypothetical protein
LALHVLGKECDAGSEIPNLDIMWVRKGSSFTYACNYSDRRNPCYSSKLDEADAIPNMQCQTEGSNKEELKKMAWWVQMKWWKETYGRARYGDKICDNLPRWKAMPAMPVKGPRLC